MLRSLLPWLKRKPPRELVTPVSVRSVRFLSEQDGPVERDLKARWLPILSASPQVRRAFLLRASYEGQSGEHVVLALCCSGGSDSELLEALRVPYAAIFHRDCPLDIAFASPTQESQIEKVCPPFYTAV
jgi:hypothetical protein